MIGPVLNNKLTGKLIELAASANEASLKSFLKSETAEYVVDYFWNKYYFTVFFATQLVWILLTILYLIICYEDVTDELVILTSILVGI